MGSFSEGVDELMTEPLFVKAKLHLYPTEEGGKTVPIADGYRPNHNFGGPDGRDFFVGQVEIRGEERMFPGDTHEVFVHFLDSEGLKDHLVVGNVWRIQEGISLVGTAEILSVGSET